MRKLKREKLISKRKWREHHKVGDRLAGRGWWVKRARRDTSRGHASPIPYCSRSTGHASTMARSEAHGSGAVDYVTDPFGAVANRNPYLLVPLAGDSGIRGL